MLEQLADSGFVHTARRSTATVRIHGVGPLSDAIERALVAGGVSTRRSRGYRNTDVVRTWNEQLVVLADDVVTDPRLVSDLVRCGLPHLSIRIRDGNGEVGPLVLPGQSSCLRCADILRSELDPHWLHLSAQLLGSAGHAESAMIHASVALALAEIDSALSETAATHAASLSSTLEIAFRPVSDHNQALASANILQLPIPGTCFGQRTPQSDMMVWCPRSHARVLPVLPNSRASPWGWPVAPPWASDASSPAATKARSTRS